MIFISPLDNVLFLVMIAFALLGLDAYRINLEGWTKCALSASLFGILLCARAICHTQTDEDILPDEIIRVPAEDAVSVIYSTQRLSPSLPLRPFTTHDSLSGVDALPATRDQKPSILSSDWHPRPWIGVRPHIID